MPRGVLQKAEGVIERITVSPWIERLAKLGYASKGVVHLLVGVLTVMAAVGVINRPAGTRAVFKTIAAQSFGRFLFASIAIGLISFIIRRFVQMFVELRLCGGCLSGGCAMCNLP